MQSMPLLQMVGIVGVGKKSFAKAWNATRSPITVQLYVAVSPTLTAAAARARVISSLAAVFLLASAQQKIE